MRWPLVFGSAALLCCTEAPRMQPPPPVPDGPDMAQTPPADLVGVPDPVVDLQGAPPTLTKITPALTSTAGGGQVTLTGSNFSTRTVFFVNNLQVDASNVTATQATLLLPPLPGQIGPARVSARNPDGQAVQNSNTGGSQTALSLYAGTVRFSVGSVYNAETTPRALAQGDINGDGKSDVVVGNFSVGTYNVLLGDGTGNLTRGNPDRFNTISNQAPFQFILADLNADKILDLIAGTASNTLQYYIGTGGGRFDTTTKSYTGTLPIQSQGIGDFNNDGKPDIVVCNTSAVSASTGTIGVYYNTGATNADLFPTAVVNTTITNSPTRLAVGDVDLDGRPDVVFTGQVNALYSLGVLLGTGTQASPWKTLATYGTNSANQIPQWVELADLNKDGKLDAVVTDSNTSSVRVFLGNGTSVSTFTAPTQSIPVSLNPMQVSVADVNGDTIPDLIVVNSNNLINSFSVLIGKGDGTFNGRIDFPAQNNPWAIQVANLNGDTLPDLILVNQTNVANVAPGNVTTLINTSQ